MISQTIPELYERCVRFYGPHSALTYHGKTFTYNEIGSSALSLAHALQEELGIKKGDKVAFLMPNCPEYVFCEYAVAKTGAVRVPLAVLLGNSDHIYMMNQAECKTLIYHQKMDSRVEEMLPGLETVSQFICVSEKKESIREGHYHLQSLAEKFSPSPEIVEIDPEDLLGIYFTGGTTGKPKGVMLSHRAWVYTILIEMLEFGFGWEEVFAYLTPLTHAGGCLLLPVLLRKGRAVIFDSFDPSTFLKSVEDEGITSTFMVPTMLYAILDSPELKKYSLKTLRNIIYGAAPIAPERLKQAINTFGPILTQLFGQTEAPMCFTVMSHSDHVIEDPAREREIFSSAGRPTFHSKIRILDDNGRAVPAGEPGEVVVKCANVMHGYLKNPEATAATLQNGWLYTGDIAKEDEEGFLYIVDRKKDMVVSGGFNIFPREIEDILFEHPAVKQAAVIGVPDEKWGEAVKAIVILYGGESTTEKELINFVKDRKGSVAAPKSVEFWDSIPLTNLGKVDKKTMREQFWKNRTRKV